MIRNIKAGVVICLISFSLVFSVRTTATADSVPPGPFEQMGYTIIPAGYGELLNVYGRAIEDNPDVAFKQISEKLSAYTQAIGRVVGIVDVAGKIYTGDNSGAAISASMTIFGELAGSTAGKAFLGAYGLTTLPVTTLIVAVQVYQITEAELSKATIGRQLESLYGSIESDPLLKNLNRTIGTGDPIPVNQESIEYVWRKILFNDSWRNLFKVYVSQELGVSDWPEASRWERWTLPGNAIEDAALLENEKEYKSYIAGLLSRLNTVAKKRESAFVIRKYGKELLDKFSGASPADILKAYVAAVKKLPEVRQFVKDCPGLVARGLQERNFGPLETVIGSSKSYAVNVLNYLPSTGTIGEERKELMAKLKQYHDEAWGARSFVRESLMREDQLKAASVPVRSWRATKVGFGLSFAQLQSTIQKEFSQTGATKQVSKSIAAAWNSVYTSYYDQEQKVKEEYQQAMQNPPVSEDRNDAAYGAFLQQLGAYRSIDNQLYSELMSRVSAFVATLQQQKQMRRDVLYSLSGQLNKIKNDQLITFSNEGTELVTRYCSGGGCNFPEPNYVGLLKMKFPQPGIDDDNPSTYDFKMTLLNHISALMAGPISEGRWVLFSDGKRKYLDQLIEVPSLDILSDDKLAQLKQSVARYREILTELQSKLEDYPGTPPLTADAHIAFLDRVSPLQKQLAELAETARNMQQSYQTTLGNVENDKMYLNQLESVIRSLEPILKTFIERYRNRANHSGASRSGPFLFNPDLADPAAIDHSPTLMTPKDIDKAMQQLQGQLVDSRLVWLDQKYHLGLTLFVDSFITKYSSLKSAQDPGHYQFILYRQESGGLYFDEDFDALAKALEGIDKTDSFFPNELHKAVRMLRGAGLLGMPSFGFSDFTLDDLPKDNLKVLESAVKKSWDPEMATSLQKVIDVFTNKLSAYREWQKKEAYFQEMYKQFAMLSTQFSNLEYEAEAANMAMKNASELIPLYEKAVAMEAPIGNFLGAAVADPKLSSSRQLYFSDQTPGYEKRFYSLKEMLRNLKQRSSNLAGQKVFTANENKIKLFYESFQQAYTEKNESQLLSYLSDAWEAGDGTTLYDVEDYFHNMFNVFDEIQMTISGLNVKNLEGDRYLVNYETSIIGRIFSDGLEHEEKSSVAEEVEVSSSGKVKIIRTPQGRFWYVK